MTTPCLLKSTFAPFMVVLLMVSQISTAVAASINAGKKTDTSSSTAVIRGTDSARIKEDDDPDGDNLLEASGKLKITDNDAGEAAFIATTLNGNYGNFVISAPGHWYYAAENSQNSIQNLNNNDTVKDSFTVSSIDGTTHDVVITIKGLSEINTIDTNYPAVISGVDSGSVTEDNDPDADELLEVSAKLNITDNDSGEAAFIATASSTNYGSLTIDTTGNWRYAAKNNQSIIQSLNSNDTLRDTSTVSSIDGTKHTIVITINGVDEANQAAVISGIDSGSITEDVDPDGDGLLEVSGKLTITDSDTGEAAFIATAYNGNYGNLIINTSGSWSYAAANDQGAIQNLTINSVLTENLTVSSIDGTKHTIVITIKGVDEANQAAIISGTDTGSVTEDVDPDGDGLLEVSGKLTITDNDTGEAAFIATAYNGNYGKLIINSSGSWSYAAANDQGAIQNLTINSTLTENLTVSSIDGTKHTIVITINGVDEANQAAIISGTDTGSVTEDVDPDGDSLLEVSGKLYITDSDAGEAAFIASSISGNYGELNIDTSGNWNYLAHNQQAAIQNLASGEALTENLVINSIDGTGHTVKITILGADENNASGNFTLSWVAPAERENNQPISLSEIAGYKIYYGTAQGQYANSVTINDSAATEHTFNDFPSGTYYFIVTTIDSEGRESKYSSSVTIAI